MARFHAAGADFQQRRENALGPKGWRKLADDCAASADLWRPDCGILIEEELCVLNSNWPRNLPQGAIHADLFPDNVLFVNNRISGIIDLYFACNDALAYDLAVALNSWCFESDGAFNVTNARALIAGYETQRALLPEERDLLPVLCRGAALRFLLTRLYDWINHNPAALVRPKDPKEFLRRRAFTGRSKTQGRTDCERRCTGKGGCRPNLYGRCVQRKSRPGRLGRHPSISRSRERIFWRRTAHHQQPHGIDGGDQRSGILSSAPALS